MSRTRKEKFTEMRLAAVARAYLGDDPGSWYTFARGLSARASQTALSKIGVSETIPLSVLEDAVLSSLMSPSTALLVAKARNPKAAVEALVATIAQTIALTPIASEADDGWHIDDVGLTDDGRLELWSYYNATGNDDRGVLTVYEGLRIEADSQELAAQVEEEACGLKPTEAIGEGTLFRLDIIDIALYKAILRHPEILHCLDWRTFERLLADILAEFGFDVELMQGTKDGGVDIVAVKHVGPFGPERYLLQAKRWTRKVGIEPVRQLIFLHSYHRATKGCLATTSTFTRGAWQMARQYPWQLELRDEKGLLQWLSQAAKLKCPT